MVLVLANGAVPSSDSLVLAHHDVLRDLVKETVSKLVNSSTADLEHETYRKS